MHLHPYRKYQSESQVPESVTQLGIAKGVDISYTHVPRAVKRLQEQGLIIELMAHVDNQPTSRRRKAYFLTERGLIIASELQSSLADLSVAYKDENGNTSKVLLKDINELLNSNEDLFTLFRCLDSDSMFDITSWNKKKKLISIQSHEKFGAAPKVENQNIRLNLKEAKELLGLAFDSAEIEAIYHHTEGNPEIIKYIKEIKESNISELEDLSAEERALTLCIMARAKLEKDTNNASDL